MLPFVRGEVCNDVVRISRKVLFTLGARGCHAHRSVYSVNLASSSLVTRGPMSGTWEPRNIPLIQALPGVWPGGRAWHESAWTGHCYQHGSRAEPRCLGQLRGGSSPFLNVCPHRRADIRVSRELGLLMRRDASHARDSGLLSMCASTPAMDVTRPPESGWRH